MSRRLPGWAAPAGALAALAVFLLPALHTALRGDDVWSFEQAGRLRLEGESLLAFILEGAWVSVVDQGRPQPVGGVQSGLVIALFGDHRVLYKAFLLALTLLCAGLLWALIRRLGGSRALAALAVVLLAGAIQIRQYHDPLLAYHGIVQAVLACTLGSLLALERRRLVAGAALFALGCTVYEIAPTLVVLHVALAWRLGRVRDAVPFAAVAAGFVALAVLGRLWETDNTYEAGTGLGAVVETYLVQLLPPIPGSPVLFGDTGADPTPAELLGGLWRGAVVAVAVYVLGRRLGRVPAATLALLGAGLWLAPIAPIALSAKYQAELSAATGYLPVLMQSFGWALVLAAVVALAARRRAALAAAALALGVLAGLAGLNNLRVAAFDQPAVATHELLHDGPAAGVLDGVPEGATIYIPERDLGFPTTLYREGRRTLEALLLDQTGRRYDVHVMPGEPCSAKDPCAEEGAWMRLHPTREGGSVTVARVGAEPFGAPARQLWLYAEDGRRPVLTGQIPGGAPWDGSPLVWRRDGAVWTVRPQPAPVADLVEDPDSPIDYSALVSPPEWVRRLGTRRVLP